MAAGPLAAQLVWNYVTETGRKLEIDVILAKPNLRIVALLTAPPLPAAPSFWRSQNLRIGFRPSYCATSPSCPSQLPFILAKPEPPYWLSPALGRLDQAQRDLEIPHDPVELGSTFRHP